MEDDSSLSEEKQIEKQECIVDNLPVNLNDCVQAFESICLTENVQRSSTSLPNSPAAAIDGILCPMRSQGGTPILGSQEIILPRWKLGPPTPVQALSPNSAALTLLALFTQGSVQMQWEAVKHLKEGNLAKLNRVTIELPEPNMGRVMGVIPDVNFIDNNDHKPNEESIGDMLGKLESGNEGSISIDLNSKIDYENNNCYSMGKQKQGKTNPTEPSLLQKQPQRRKQKRS